MVAQTRSIEIYRDKIEMKKHFIQKPTLICVFDDFDARNGLDMDTLIWLMMCQPLDSDSFSHFWIAYDWNQCFIAKMRSPPHYYGLPAFNSMKLLRKAAQLFFFFFNS